MVEVKYFVGILVLVLVLIISVATFLILGGTSAKSINSTSTTSISGTSATTTANTTSGATSAELFFSTSRFKYYSAYGNSLTNATSSEFMLLNVSTPIPVVVINNTLYSSGNALSELALSKMIDLTQTLKFPIAPIIDSKGLVNEPSVTISNEEAGRASIDQLSVYIKDSSWTIYTNGTRYYVTNGTYSEYFFIYANENTIISIPNTANALSRLVNENNESFPVQFSAYLSNITQGFHAAFLPDSTWWYCGYGNASFISPGALPGGYQKWSGS